MIFFHLWYLYCKGKKCPPKDIYICITIYQGLVDGSDVMIQIICTDTDPMLIPGVNGATLRLQSVKKYSMTITSSMAFRRDVLKPAFGFSARQLYGARKSKCPKVWLELKLDKQAATATSECARRHGDTSKPRTRPQCNAFDPLI